MRSKLNLNNLVFKMSFWSDCDESVCLRHKFVTVSYSTA